MGLLSQILGGMTGGGHPAGGGAFGGGPLGGRSPGGFPGAGGFGGAGAGLGGSGRTALMMAMLPVVLRMLQQRQAGASGRAPMGAGGLGGGGLSGLGGLGGLLDRFSQRGHGDAVSSWVSTGPNQPLSRGMVDQTFDDGEVAAIAREAGVGEDEARDGLSELLPDVVDHLTPDGRLPPPDQSEAGIEQLLRRMQAS